jgi:hypothetical protein
MVEIMKAGYGRRHMKRRGAASVRRGAIETHLL